jgi:ATP-dependent helicase/nuclease subunit B
MLNVRYGPFQPSLERAFLDEIAELRAADPTAPVAVVTPSRRLADRLQRLVALESNCTYVGLRFHTFFSLALEVLRDVDDVPDVVRDPAFFDRVIDGLLAGENHPKGLAGSYRASLKDLIDAGIEPRAVELLEEGLLPEGVETQRLKGLLETLKAFQTKNRLLGVVPASELVKRATVAAPQAPSLKRCQRLLYYGFYDLTGLQADFFEAVASHHPTTLYFPYIKGHAAYTFGDRFFSTKLHLGGKTPEALPVETSGRALGPSLSTLFESGKSAKMPSGAIRFFNASGARDEAWRAAKEILRIREEEGIEYHDIGVVSRTLDAYRAPIREAFAESLIPYHSSASEPLLRAPAARAAATLLQLARRDFPALLVLDLVGSPFFGGEPGAHWRALVERLRIHRGWLQWEGKLEPTTRENFELFPQLKAEGRRGLAVSREETARLWELLVHWRRKLQPIGRRSWAGWAEYAESFLRQELDAQGAPGFDEVLTTLRSLKIFDRLGADASFEEFLEAAEDRLRAAVLPPPEKQNRGVRVLDAMEARGDRFKVLFILGMQEGLFPRTIREDPLLRDTARNKLREVGGYWINAKQAGYDEEKLLFHLLVSAADERLYLSYPRSNEEGRVQVPSIYLMELCRAAGLRLKDSKLNEHLPRQPEAKLTHPQLQDYLSPKEASLAMALTGGASEPLHRALGFDAPGYAQLLRRVHELNRSGKPGAMDGIIGGAEEFLQRLRERGLSPSALETLARCSFQFYASRVLGLDEPREPSQSGEISPAVKGEIYHRILRDFHKRLGDSDWWDKREKDFPERSLTAAARDVFKDYGWRELGVYPLLWDIARESMRAHLRRFLDQDIEELRLSGMRPQLLEERLAGPLPVKLPPALKGLEFSGIADRIDVGGGRFRVVDYKTHNRREPLARRVLAGKAFQAPVYLDLAAQHTSLQGFSAEGARFAAIEDADAQSYGAKTHSENSSALYASLSRLVDGVAQGEFVIRPDEGRFGHCQWCSFGDLCRKNHSATLWRSRWQ